jgi:hypothetical protein
VLCTYGEGDSRRVALYSWHGQLASTEERALVSECCLRMLREGSEGCNEHATFVVVHQNCEPEHFVALFDGRMLVHSVGVTRHAAEGGVGYHTDYTRAHDGVALFHVKQAANAPTVAPSVRTIQVPSVAGSLVSTDCFVLRRPGAIDVWHGGASTPTERSVARQAAQAVSERLQLIAEASKEEAAKDAASDGAHDGADEPFMGELAAVGTGAFDEGTSAPRAMCLRLHEGCEMPGGMHEDKLGVFCPTGTQSNGRPCYVREDTAEVMLWWGGGRWWLGRHDERGQNRGWIKADSEALCPPTDGWLVYSRQERAWLQAHALHAAPAERLWLGGRTPQGVHAEKCGTFVRIHADVNERPAYFHETRLDLMLWWGGGRWWLGKRAELGMNRGWIKAVSEAHCPADVAPSPWLVYSNTDRKWFAANAFGCRRISGAWKGARKASIAAAAAGEAITPVSALRGGSDVALHGGSDVWVVHECEEGHEPAEFWQALGGKGAYASERQPAALPAFAPRLFHCSNSVGTFGVAEVFYFTQADLDHDDMYILDCWSSLFVWVGRRANATERAHAVLSATRYARLQAAVDGRSLEAPIAVVHAGFEPPPFTCNFVDWSEEVACILEDPYENRSLQHRGSPTIPHFDASRVLRRADTSDVLAAQSRLRTPPLLRPPSSSTAADLADLAPPKSAYAASDAKHGANVADVTRQVQAIFHEIDKDGSGTIDRKELGTALKADGELEALLGEADAKGIRDVVALLRKLEEGKVLDADGDSKITLDEFERAVKRAAAAAPPAVAPVEEPAPVVDRPAAAPAAAPAARVAPGRSELGERSPARVQVTAAAERALAAEAVMAAMATVPSSTFNSQLFERGSTSAPAGRLFGTAAPPVAGFPQELPAAARLPRPSFMPASPNPASQATLAAQAAAEAKRQMPPFDASRVLRRADTSDVLAAQSRLRTPAEEAAPYERPSYSPRVSARSRLSFTEPDKQRLKYEEITSGNGSVTLLNPVCKELYLLDEDFQKLFNMSKREFYELRPWKQRELKKSVGLF